MAGDAYQGPGFAWLHAARAAGNAALTLPEAVSSATPKARLLDSRARDLVQWTADGDKAIRLDRGAFAREPVNRLVIPPGHNLAGHRIDLLVDAAGTWASPTSVLPYSRPRGSVQTNAMQTIHAGLNVLDFPPQGSRYIGVSIKDRASNVPELGEFWLTRTWRPTWGFDPRYEGPELVPNAAVQTLASGAASVDEQGELRRRWLFSTLPLYGSDWRIYERMLREAGVVRDPILFEGTRGDYYNLIDDFSDADVSDWFATECALVSGTGSPFIGSRTLVMAPTGTPDASATLTLPSPIDLRGCIFRAAVRTTSLAWATATTGFFVLLASEPGSWATWDFGTNHLTATGRWTQLSMDLDTDAPVSASGSSVDLSAVAFIIVGCHANIAAQTVTWGLIDYLRKESQPIIARIDRAGAPKQRSTGPTGSGEYRGVELELVEAIE